MSSWRDNLRPASFRSAPFFFVSAGGTFGRRGQSHEYPLRDDPYFEDLGRKARSFTLEGVVVGPSYAADRDTLIAACEQAGAGRLVHPVWGEMDVACTACQVRESTREGGAVFFSLTFAEAGKVSSAALVTPQTGSRVSAASDNARAAALNAFARNFSVAGQPPFVSASALKNAVSLTGALGTIRRLMPTDPVAGFGFTSQIATLKQQLSALMASPADLGSGIAGLVRSVALLPGLPSGLARASLLGALDTTDPSAAAPLAIATLIDAGGAGTTDPAASADATRRSYLALSTIDPSYSVAWGAPPPDSIWTAPTKTTDAAQADADNQSALLALTRQTALAAAARASAATQFVSYDDAVAARDDIAERLDTEILGCSDDDTRAALRTLRIAAVRDLTNRALELPRLHAYTPSQTLPAIVAAYRLYDEPSRAAEIVARNSIPHPGFLPARRPLKVLDA